MGTSIAKWNTHNTLSDRKDKSVQQQQGSLFQHTVYRTLAIFRTTRCGAAFYISVRVTATARPLGRARIKQHMVFFFPFFLLTFLESFLLYRPWSVVSDAPLAPVSPVTKPSIARWNRAMLCCFFSFPFPFILAFLSIFTAHQVAPTNLGTCQPSHNRFLHFLELVRYCYHTSCKIDSYSTVCSCVLALP